MDDINENKSLYSPNKMVQELFESLRRMCNRLSVEQDESITRQDSALCIILSVQCVEVFFNMYFRTIASESEFEHISERLLVDLKNTRFGLEQKIKQWPELVFGEKLNLDKAAGQRFVALKDLRHKLMHFSSSHESILLQGIAVHGLADASIYDSLTAKSALEALKAAEDFICEVFKLRGLSHEKQMLSLRLWMGAQR